jgi:hypothetical protein
MSSCLELFAFPSAGLSLGRLLRRIRPVDFLRLLHASGRHGSGTTKSEKEQGQREQLSSIHRFSPFAVFRPL